MSAHVTRAANAIVNPLLSKTLSLVSMAVAISLAGYEETVEGQFEAILRPNHPGEFIETTGSAPNPLFYQKFFIYWGLTQILFNSQYLLGFINRYLFSQQQNRKSLYASLLSAVVSTFLLWNLVDVAPTGVVNNTLTKWILSSASLLLGFIQSFVHFIGDSPGFNAQKLAYPITNRIFRMGVFSIALFTMLTDRTWSGALNLRTINTPSPLFQITAQNFLTGFLSRMAEFSSFLFITSGLLHLIFRTKESPFQTSSFRLTRFWFFASLVGLISTENAKANFNQSIDCVVTSQSNPSPNRFVFGLQCLRPLMGFNIASSLLIGGLLVCAAYFYMRDRQTWHDSDRSSDPHLFEALVAASIPTLLVASVTIALGAPLSTIIGLTASAGFIASISSTRIMRNCTVDLFRDGRPFGSWTDGFKAGLSTIGIGFITSLWIDANFSSRTLHAFSIIPMSITAIISFSFLKHRDHAQLDFLNVLQNITRMATPLAAISHLFVKLSNHLGADPVLFSGIRIFRALSIPMMCAFSIAVEREQDRRLRQYNEDGQVAIYNPLDASEAKSMPASSPPEGAQPAIERRYIFLTRYMVRLKDIAVVASACVSAATLFAIRSFSDEQTSGTFSYETQDSSFGTATSVTQSNHKDLFVFSMTMSAAMSAAYIYTAVKGYMRPQRPTPISRESVVRSGFCCRRVSGSTHLVVSDEYPVAPTQYDI